MAIARSTDNTSLMQTYLAELANRVPASIKSNSINEEILTELKAQIGLILNNSKKTLLALSVALNEGASIEDIDTALEALKNAETNEIREAYFRSEQMVALRQSATPENVTEEKTTVETIEATEPKVTLPEPEPEPEPELVLAHEPQPASTPILAPEPAPETNPKTTLPSPASFFNSFFNKKTPITEPENAAQSERFVTTTLNTRKQVRRIPTATFNTPTNK